MDDSVGVMEGHIDCSYFQGRSLIKWMNQFLEQMSLTMDAECFFINDTRNVYLDLYTWNVDKEFQELSVGSDIRYNGNSWR